VGNENSAQLAAARVDEQSRRAKISNAENGSRRPADRSDRDTGHKISRKNKQAPLGKLLPELTKPWSWPQLHKQEGKLTKKKGPARASGTAATRRQLTQELQARNDGELHFSAANSKTAKHKDAQKGTRRIRELRSDSGCTKANISIEIHTSLQPIRGGHRPPSLI
jgi:hypothetical protein